jgi:hypothetical protein
MTSRALRLFVAMAVVALLAGAGYRVVLLQRLQTADRAALDFVSDESHEALVGVARLGAAQRSYMAGGQAVEFWTTRVTASLDELQSRLTRLHDRVEAEPARRAIQTAQSIAADFRKLDASVRDHLDASERLLASDLIFTEAVQLLDGASEQIETGRTTAVQALAGRVDARGLEQAWWLVAAGTLAALAALVLAWSPGRAQAVARPADPVETDADDLPLAPPAPAPRPASPADVSLHDAASLCSDLARVSEPAHLRSGLESTARILNARGVVLWVAGESGTDLRPAAAHGYSAEALSRLGLIPTTAENATAAAFRGAALVTVPAAGASHGAIVAPVVGAAGCTGVLSIEVPDGVERSEAARALAVILAAQLSGLVASPPASAPAAAQA